MELVVDGQKIEDAIEKLFTQLGISKIEIDYNENIQFCVKCAKEGWIVPSFIEEDEFDELIRLEEISEIDDFMIKFFEKNIENIRDEFLRKRWLEEYKKAYKEAYFNYCKHNYIACTMILVAVFEGICSKVHIIDNNGKRNAVASINRYFNSKYTNKKTIIYSDREGLKEFVKKLYKSVDFNSNTDGEGLNRNILMHGINFNNIGRKESMKMFNAIEILVSLIEF